MILMETFSEQKTKKINRLELRKKSTRQRAHTTATIGPGRRGM